MSNRVLALADHNLIGVLQSFLWQRRGMEATYNDTSMALALETIRDLIGARRIARHRIQAQHVSASDQTVVVKGTVELLIGLNVVPGLFHDAA